MSRFWVGDKPGADALAALVPETVQRKLETRRRSRSPRKEPPKKPAGTPGPARPAAGAKGQSHIRQARPQQAPRMPSKGPMADMLRKLLGNDDGKA